MIGNKGMMCAGAIGTVLLMILGVFAIPVSVSAAPVSVSDKITTDTGSTTDFGGGDYFYVKFGSDAAFGVVWGTDSNPNNVYLVAIKARYLGIAQVYDMQGNPVATNDTIKIYTVYAVKLDGIIEYNDTDSNGILNYVRTYDNGNFTDVYMAPEPIYKKVDMKTAWTQSAVAYQEAADAREWTFSLSASNLPYMPLGSYTGPTGDNVLNNMTLTFHLSANLIQVDNATLPQWRITVQKGMMGNMYWFNDIQRMDDYRVSGKVFKYDVKWDQTIDGWDFDAANTVNPALLMEFQAMVGNYIPSGVATWMSMEMVRSMNEYGYAYCRETSGDANLTDETGTYSTPRPLASPMLTFGGKNTRIGALEWVSNVTVDGQQKQLHAQIMAGVPVWARAMNGAVFRGFAVLGGISYPGGAMIVHDPTFSSEALVDVGSASTTKVPTGLILIGAAVAAIVLIAIIALVLMERKPGQKVQQNYERTMSSQPGEWAKYYNKK